MIVKEVRADRWAVLFGLFIIVLRTFSAVTTNLNDQSVAALNSQFDADFSAVAAHHVSGGTAFLWATFFSDLMLYLLIGFGGAILGARLVASETSSGSIYVLLSRPVSRTRALLTKYGVAAAISLVLCALSACIALVIGAVEGVAAPPLGGFLLSVVLLWLAMLFVVGLTMLYSVLVPSALAAGVLGFFTIYIATILPVFHSETQGHITYFLGGPDWSLPTYWGSLGIYAGVDSPVKSLVISAIAALIPVVLALVVFVRKSF